MRKSDAEKWQHALEAEHDFEALKVDFAAAKAEAQSASDVIAEALDALASGTWTLGSLQRDLCAAQAHLAKVIDE